MKWKGERRSEMMADFRARRESLWRVVYNARRWQETREEDGLDLSGGPEEKRSEEKWRKSSFFVKLIFMSQIY
jgi:hypothetical protein